MFDLLISTQSFIFLMIASFLAGFLDSIAGGGGLISLPAYMLSGLPMHMVYACNKFAAACGTSNVHHTGCAERACRLQVASLAMRSGTE